MDRRHGGLGLPRQRFLRLSPEDPARQEKAQEAERIANHYCGCKRFVNPLWLVGAESV